MSVNSKITAIADKIRAIQGSSGKMGFDAMATNLGIVQTNITSAFTAIGNKSGTVPSSKVSGNLVSAINSIPLGVTVQTKTGTLSVGTTVNCEFKPDFVVIINTEAGADGWYHPAFAFTAMNSETLLAQAEIMDGFYYFGLTRTSTGFTVDFISFYDFVWNGVSYNGTFEFIAIKYT